VDEQLRRQAEATLDWYHQLSGTSTDRELGRFLVEPTRPQVWDANHVRRARAGSDRAIDELLAEMDRVYAAMGHRQINVDTDTPDRLEARLALDGWTAKPAIQHLLRGPLRLDLVTRAAPSDLVIRPAVDGDDWVSMGELTRLDHLEGAHDEGREAWAPSVTQDIVDHRRAKAPHVQAWLAQLDGRDVGMFSSMGPPPGDARIGLVEDLFVHPDWRGRGISVELIARCVADARDRGADQVLIGSDPDDWPKGLYARLGFAPAWVDRWWTAHPGGGVDR
jgi:GNAT superfamily N-acetyltransferase